MACIGFKLGCTCSDCQTRYFIRHANSCTYAIGYVGRQLAQVLKHKEKQQG